MVNLEPTNESDTASQADEIASKIFSTLIATFKLKTGNDPTEEELEELLSEMTEERIQAMLDGREDEDCATEKNEEVPSSPVAQKPSPSKRLTPDGIKCDKENSEDVGSKRKKCNTEGESDGEVRFFCFAT